MKDWKESAIERRNERHTKIDDSNIKPSAVNKKKNTKKWCRGKVGVEHKAECKTYYEAKNIDNKHKPRGYLSNWYILVCSECGKELDHYYGNAKYKPAWVTI